MKKKKIISGILAAAITCAAAFSGCSLITTDTEKDYKQTVAEVNISKVEAFNKEFKDNAKYFDAVGTTKIIKRELVTYFVNVGYSYMNIYGWSYADTFDWEVDQLASTAVLTQYATMYLLQEKDNKESGALEKFKGLKTEIEKYEYLLGENSDDVKIAKYQLMSSINSAIDNQEKDILKSEDSDAGSETRATPGNVDTEKEDFYPKKRNSNGEYVNADGVVIPEDAENADYVLDYGIYTGYKNYGFGDSGVYQTDRDKALEKSTSATRIRAYTKFVSTLISFGLIDTKKENLQDVWGLNYMQDEYVNQLKSRVITKYCDMYEDERLEYYTSDDSILPTLYNMLFEQQKDNYKTEDNFASSLGNMSDSAFVLYAPETENGGTFGFVYNILLPFSTSQSADLSAYQTLYKDDEVESGYSSKYYEKRNTELLKHIKTTDQRAAWFNGATEYAFDAKDKVDGYYKSEKGGSDWLFFENNLTDTERYEALDKYIGKYSYNGKVVKNADGKYVFGSATYLTIDDMLKEFSGYINYVLGTENSVTFEGGYELGTANEAYYQTTDFYKKTEGGEYDKNDDDQYQIDYSKLIYASGKVNGLESDGVAYRTNLFNKESAQYKAMAAVNELQYAYTTDTGVLSQYVGYSVEAGDTNYIKEFEYAAHEAVNNGAGSFSVCAGDYGWHLIYVTYTFDISKDGEGNQLGGEVYDPDWTKITEEGTFEYFFYEWVKNNNISDISSTRQTQITKKYKLDGKTVTKHKKAYKDLTSLG